MAKWITFEPLLTKTQTGVWAVNTLAGVTIGRIKWYSSWRQYSFFPEPSTVFERRCLRDIAEFCELETAKWRSLPRLRIEEKLAVEVR